MSQQSNPETLREAAKLLAMHLKHAESGGELEEDLIFATLEKVAALAASGTEAAPPVRSASSKTTENGLRDVGTVTRAQVSSAEGSVATSTPKRGPRTANHLEHVQRFLTEMYQVMVDPVEEFNGNIEQLCSLLIARAKQDRETIHGRGQGERHLTESQKAVEEAAGMNLDWNMATGYDAGQLSAQVAASPEGEGREAQTYERVHSRVWQNGFDAGKAAQRDVSTLSQESLKYLVPPELHPLKCKHGVLAGEYCSYCEDAEIEQDAWAKYQDQRAALRQSAAPSGREATRAEAEVWLEQNGYPYLEQLFNEFVDGPITRSRMNSLLAPLFAQFVLAQESKTGAVTETK